MHQLSSSTVRLITSSQVITSVTSAVKELVENSLDAKSTSIEVKVENYGLDKIEVRDNGCGVVRGDVDYMGQAHYTSKLSSTEDLDTLSTYGFRGEALGSLCSVSDVTVTTKTSSDDVSYVYILDHRGQVTGSKPSHLGQGQKVLQCVEVSGTLWKRWSSQLQRASCYEKRSSTSFPVAFTHLLGDGIQHTVSLGTSICAVNLFKNLPVRKQFYSSTKKKKESLKQLEELVVTFAVIRPGVRFVLKHGRDTLWQTNPVPSSRHVLHTVLGSKVTGQLVHLERSWEDPKFELEAYLPSPSSDVLETSRSSTERLFVYVNYRPVVLKSIDKILKEHYSRGHGLDTPKYPVGFIHIQTESKLLDVNLEPNKTKVMFHKQTELLQALAEELQKFYSRDPGTGMKESNIIETSKDQETSPTVENVSGDTRSHDDLLNSPRSDNSERTVDKRQQSKDGNELEDSYSCHGNDSGFGPDCEAKRTKRWGCVDLQSEAHSKESLDSVRCVGSSTVFSGEGDRGHDLFCNNGKENSKSLRETTVSSCALKAEGKEDYCGKGTVEEKSMGKHREMYGLFSLDDSLDDLLVLTNEKLRKNSHHEERNLNSVNPPLLEDSDNNNSTLFGSKKELKESESQDGIDGMDGLNDSLNLVTSTRVVDSVTSGVVKGRGNSEGVARCNLENERQGKSSSLHHSKQPDFHLFDDSDDVMLAADVDTPVKEDLAGAGNVSGRKDTVEPEVVNESASDWSRGKAVVGSDGLCVQPVKLLQPGMMDTGAGLILSTGKRQLTGDVCQTTEKQNLSLTSTPKPRGLFDSPCQPTLFECSGSNMIKKPTSGFVTFSKEVRPKVVEDNPGVSFQDIVRITGERWGALTETERDRYEKRSNQELKRFKEQQVQLSLTSSTVTKPSRRKKLQSLSPKKGPNHTKRRPVVQQHSVKFSMNALKQRLQLSSSQNIKHSPNGSEKVRLLNDLEVGNLRFWIGIRGNQIIAFHPIRAKELLIYHKLMENHALPVESLAEPIVLTQSDFTNVHNWQTLQSLQMSKPVLPDPCCYFTDVKLVNNGFKMRQLPDPNVPETRVEIVGITRAMNYFGVGDLMEILASISVCHKRCGQCSVRQCRPPKIEHFLQAEAVRMSRQLPVRVLRKDAEETLQCVKDDFSDNTEHCFHRKPFLLTLYDLCDIPLTQTQSQP